MRTSSSIPLFFLVILFLTIDSSAQNEGAQLPKALTRSYFGVDLGYINYAFSYKQLEPGFSVASVQAPHAAVRVLFGYRLNNYLSTQLNYLRPVAFVKYANVNPSAHDYEVGMNFVTLSLLSHIRLLKNLSLQAGAGLTLATRGGFIVVDRPGVRDLEYGAVSISAGAEYALGSTWQILLQGSWSNGRKSDRQPATFFCSAGFRYRMHALPGERVRSVIDAHRVLPKDVLQLGVSSGFAGYGINQVVSKDLHIFWGGAARVATGISLQYRRQVFHTKKVFSLDWGSGASWWKSKGGGQSFFTLSIYPVFSFTILNRPSTEVHFLYSFAGPSFISKTVIDAKDTGKKFTLQDFMGIGSYWGRARKLNVEFRIAHYSNGNIFPQNNGVMIPLTFCLGYRLN